MQRTNSFDSSYISHLTSIVDNMLTVTLHETIATAFTAQPGCN